MNPTIRARRIGRAIAGVAILCLHVNVLSGTPIRFSLDPASASLDPTVTADDVLQAPGANVQLPASALGLTGQPPSGSADNLNSLSYGADDLAGPLFFSVDRVAVGAVGSAVRDLSIPGNAAAQTYRADLLAQTNRVAVGREALGLEGGFLGDDLDALAFAPNSDEIAYFTVDRLSASNKFGIAGLANDILYSRGDNRFIEFANGLIDIGLHPEDEIDALAVLDAGRPGQLDLDRDMALFSLSPFSPSAFTQSGQPYVPGRRGQLSPADILFTDFRGAFRLFQSAPELGLRPDDNVNALATPEPAAAWAYAIAVLWLAARNRREHTVPQGGHSKGAAK